MKENIIKTIGRHKYNHLKTLRELSETEQRQVEEFEERMGIRSVYEIKNPDPPEMIEGTPFEKKELWRKFLKAFYRNEGKKFEVSEQSSYNLKPIFNYFLGDEDEFISCNNVLKEFMGAELSPSLQKGLLIIGDPGNGKTSIMNAFHRLFLDAYKDSLSERWMSGQEWRRRYFLTRTTIHVSTEFENLKNFEKDDFFKGYSKGVYFFDDFGREHLANNYGKKDVFADILFERHRLKSKTYLTMNYISGDGNLRNTMIAIGERYGDHIFDRFFEMFNIIEFKGKSFRK